MKRLGVRDQLELRVLEALAPREVGAFAHELRADMGIDPPSLSCVTLVLEGLVEKAHVQRYEGGIFHASRLGRVRLDAHRAAKAGAVL